MAIKSIEALIYCYNIPAAVEKITTEAVAPKILSVVVAPHVAFVVDSLVVVIVVVVAVNNNVGQYILV